MVDIVRATTGEDLGEFTSFARLFRALMNLSKRLNYTLVLDEFQNLHYVDESLFSEIQNIWDSTKDESHINLVLCGSVYSMMTKIFDNVREPLYGRATHRINLRPFRTATLKEILTDHASAHLVDYVGKLPVLLIRFVLHGTMLLKHPGKISGTAFQPIAGRLNPSM